MSDSEAAKIARLYNYAATQARNFAATKGYAFTESMKELIAIFSREKIRTGITITYDQAKVLHAKEEASVVQKVLDGDI